MSFGKATEMHLLKDDSSLTSGGEQDACADSFESSWESDRNALVDQPIHVRTSQ
jgi:hypothetical protein